jgi:polyisoprenoid-binding protein YceI
VKLNLFVLSVAVIGLSQTLAHAELYDVDPAHSHIGFSVRHLLGKVPGEFKDFEGQIDVNEKKPETSNVKFTVKTASINTNNEKRDGHLKSGDFFDAEKFPTLTFVSKKVVPKDKKHFKLVGDMTMHGVTKPATFDLEYLGSLKDPWGNQRASFNAKSVVNRKNYGIVWNKTLDSGSTMLGEDVTIDMDVEAVKHVEGKK